MSSPAYAVERAVRQSVDFSCRSVGVLDRLARHRILVCTGIGALTILLRLAALPFFPLPYPSIHDEFSYLLAADTFAHGRLTNQPHPMWKHFETFHENFEPTYMSKYPPASAIFMAFGQRVFGHPAFGVMISFGLMCGCLCWMLQGWMPLGFALLGTIVGIAQIGLLGYWMNSYWGGAVAAAGGSLLLGALPRLARRPGAGSAIAGSVGLVLLANSRPYEGFVLAVAAAASLFFWRKPRWLLRQQLISWRILAPSAAILFAAGMAMAYYNYRVTGNPLLLPYTVNNQAYASVPTLTILPPIANPPEYRHEVIRELWNGWYAPFYYKTRNNPLRILIGRAGLIDMSKFYFSTLTFFAFLGGILLTQSHKVKRALAILGLFSCGLCLEVMLQPHYAAPAFGLFLVPVLYGLRILRLKAGSAGAALVLIFISVLIAADFARALSRYPPHVTARAKLEQKLAARSGRHLVIVRYSRQHDPVVEFVFNQADIDASQIVWAHDMGDDANRELVDFYPDRQVWLLQPDRDPPSLELYGSGSRNR